MDPQATLQRIIDMIGTRDYEEFYFAFEDLYEWIKKGGLKPSLDRIVKNGKFYKRVGTNGHYTTNRFYAIQSVDPSAITGKFELVKYTKAGLVSDRIELPLPAKSAASD